MATTAGFLGAERVAYVGRTMRLRLEEQPLHRQLYYYIKLLSSKNHTLLLVLKTLKQYCESSDNFSKETFNCLDKAGVLMFFFFLILVEF